MGAVVDSESKLKPLASKLEPLTRGWTPYVIGAVSVAVLIGLLTLPIFTFDSEQVQAAAANEAARALRYSDEKPSQPYVYFGNVGLLASARVSVLVKELGRNDPDAQYPATNFLIFARDNKEIRAAAVPDGPVVRTNWNLVILGLGFLIVAVAAVLVLQKPSDPQQPILPSPKVNSTEQYLSTEQCLITDVQRVLSMSAQLFSRSTLLLVSGLVMAFIGVAVFFVSLSDVVATFPTAPAPTSSGAESEPTQMASWFQTIGARQVILTFKSTVMLVFLEAIAWFLLRQYRALIEDYKSFYRHCMRRSNYLVAYKLAADRSDGKLIGEIVETLLAEDLTGRLKRGETTETLEGQRVIEPNFAETVVTKTSEVAQRALGHAKA
jgi:hypothetical protein